MGAVAISDANCSPHKPVRLYIKARPMMMLVRNLKTIGTLSAVLPHGPANKVQDYAEEENKLANDELYDLFLARMEAELVNLSPLAEKEIIFLSAEIPGRYLCKRVLWMIEFRDLGKPRLSRVLGRERPIGWATSSP